MGLALCLVGALTLAAAPLPTAAERAALIEANRKGDVIVQVTFGGKPVPGVRVEIRQVRHRFLFGANIFGLRPGDPSPVQEAYQERFTDLFNCATLPFYWGHYERERDRPAELRLAAMAGWCRAKGLEVKGHPVFWHEVFPSWVDKDERMEPLIRKRIAETVGRFRGLVDWWDVVNESLVAPEFDNAWGLFVKGVGPLEAVDRALRLAAEANPEGVFLVNDFKIEPAFEQELAALEERGAPFHAIGLQSHMHGGEWTLERAWEVCETYGRLGLPLHFTELTVLSGPRETPMMDYHRNREGWLTTPEEEAKQAEYVERFYEVLFAHPAVEAITWWDLSDHRAWMRAPAGLIRKDMSPKPAYERLMRKIKGQWWTERAEATTWKDGRAHLRGFLGEYEGTVRFPDGAERRLSFEIRPGPAALVRAGK
jgi:GH35 family endo-1,4-beta-xylanase